MKNLLLPFLFLMATIISLPTQAQEQPNEPTAQTETEAIKMLNGTWEWKQTRFASRGVQPTVKTPESTGRKITVTFKPDNIASVFENGKLVTTFQYSITRPMNEYLMISFKGNEGQSVREYLEEGPLTVSANTLHIAGGYNDAGSNITFKKLQPAKTTKKAKKKKKK
ncbi:hypothetical protein [Adhaeribacter soli]|uniref:Uncharacterized protein n=1 Tax=Adhaeribacter soli TaxID=2607655 RepID=A0A5N1IYL4_9BACT|nr:hypothetical protein [Adhaeribacter soli]KAA9333579.1 hypothetical protein F0P94_10000 [Adhaeribacter soli]